jgi:hypothetical protein
MTASGQDYTMRTVETSDEGVTFNDLNETLIASLSEKDQSAYYLALLGEAKPEVTTQSLDTDGNGAIGYEESFGHGCSGDAHRAVLGVFAARAILTEEYNDLRLTTKESSQPVKLAESDWIRCLDSAGIKGVSRTTLLSSLESRFDQPNVVSHTKACDEKYLPVLHVALAEAEDLFVKEHAEILENYGVRSAS